jgi:chitinase
MSQLKISIMKLSFKSLFIFSLLSLFLTLFSCTGKKDNYMIVGYIAGYRGFDFNSIQVKKLTHINYAFANIINGEIKFDTSEIDNAALKRSDIESLNKLKAVNPELKVIVSVGGWGWSGNFSDAALNDSTRGRFAKSAVGFIKENDIDGIDLDWEYPNQPGAGNVYRRDDIHNFTLLLKKLREDLDSLAKTINPEKHLLLTIATGGDSSYVANTELGEVAKYTDFINLMTYDLHNGNTWQAGHHTNLYLSEFDSPFGDATDRAVKMHINAGVPPEKINIGIPFYGRRWKGVIPVNNGLYQEAASGGEGISYSSVMEAIKNPSYERFWDESASSPWLWDKKDSIFISYDDTVSIELKMDYIVKKGLGGAMFWEYTENKDGSLLNAIYKGLYK